jgi:hypothetical protein
MGQQMSHESLIAETAATLQRSAGDPECIRAAVFFFLNRAYEAGIEPNVICIHYREGNCSQRLNAQTFSTIFGWGQNRSYHMVRPRMAKLRRATWHGQIQRPFLFNFTFDARMTRRVMIGIGLNSASILLRLPYSACSLRNRLSFVLLTSCLFLCSFGCSSNEPEMPQLVRDFARAIVESDLGPLDKKLASSLCRDQYALDSGLLQTIVGPVALRQVVWHDEYDTPAGTRQLFLLDCPRPKMRSKH